MKYNELSTPSLHELHGLIAGLLLDTDAGVPGVEAYGLRIYPDWHRQADEYEAALAARGEAFAAIRW
ncbi:hypothetical protein PQJ75_02400 [Rhodoplanes sp. TEM]|uniref:Uncharacterized protein n=1 Tax=Rhodoplanes tepidamans TaxID=200616 RepID=A0ABT5J629_RHOTP|nr:MULTISPECIES: hypothetical protein [Rhodoplanes]MDC7785099.1 hypothetical protein [Rhodoplanes tepidamans]MDC7982573.1 hypothetical protein [Rhodoplanes sp. TEM]MDQ0356588.1 hypothetical protein [Rhodoplanes tepidamans]